MKIVYFFSARFDELGAAESTPSESVVAVSGSRVEIKGQTIGKVMGGGGGGGFSACTIFFFRPLLVQEFFLQVKPSARIFFQINIGLFVIY